MDETPREKWAGYIGLFATIIPAMIASGFMPKANVLPFEGWLAIATGGAAFAGVIATPRWFRGAISGALTGAGILLGTVVYVIVRNMLIDSNTFWNLELVIGGMLGSVPGAILYMKWARGAAVDDEDFDSAFTAEPMS